MCRELAFYDETVEWAVWKVGAIFVFSVYVPPGDTVDGLIDLVEAIGKLLPNPVFVAGDVNAPVGSERHAFLLSCPLGNVGWNVLRPDYPTFLPSGNVLDWGFGVGVYGAVEAPGRMILSDHVMVVFRLQVSVRRRLICSTRIDLVALCDWVRGVECVSPEAFYEVLVTAVSSASRLIPIKKARGLFEWPKELTRLKHNRNRMLRRGVNIRDPIVRVVHLEFRSKQQRYGRQAERKVRAQLGRDRTGRIMWGRVRSLRPRTLQRTESVDVEEIFEELKANFTNTLPEVERGAAQHAPPLDVPWDPGTVHELMGYIRKLSDSSPGGDSITNRVLKLVIVANPVPFLVCVNMILESRIWPTQFKFALGKGIPKPGSKLPRIISLLSSWSKVCERFFNRRLRCEMEALRVPWHAQFGCRPGVSAADALLALVDLISTKNGYCFFWDAEKAFDKMPAEAILWVMSFFGFSVQTQELARSYLERRFMIFEMDGYRTAEPWQLPNGGPQGAVLLPCIYSIFVHFLCERIRSTSLGITAAVVDDVRIFVETSGSKYVDRSLLAAVAKVVYDTGLELRLVYNVGKCFIMNFRAFEFQSIPFGDACVKFRRWGKYLGVVLDSKVTFHRYLISEIEMNQVRPSYRHRTAPKNLIASHCKQPLRHLLALLASSVAQPLHFRSTLLLLLLLFIYFG